MKQLKLSPRTPTQPRKPEPEKKPEYDPDKTQPNEVPLPPDAPDRKPIIIPPQGPEDPPIKEPGKPLKKPPKAGRVFAAQFLICLFISSCTSDKYLKRKLQLKNKIKISERVNSRLLKSNGVKGTSIHVDSHNGVVILSGFVDSIMEKERAIRLAKQIEGVDEIKDALYVKSELNF